MASGVGDGEGQTTGMGQVLCQAGAFTLKAPRRATKADRPNPGPFASTHLSSHHPQPLPLMLSLSNQVWSGCACQGGGGQERVCLCGQLRYL